MGRKIFVSYKYSDSLVNNLNIWEKTTARDYVDKLSDILEEEDHIYKGEDDDESMENLADATIGSKLGDKIFDSTITIVLISKGMKTLFMPEDDQWIPWEISYSLKEQSRNGQKSKTNGVIAVVLPDENNSYEYYITRNHECNCRTLNTNFLFNILSKNMFNAKKPAISDCNGLKVYSGLSSYITSVTWDDFRANPNRYIDNVIELMRKKDEFNIHKSIN